MINQPEVVANYNNGMGGVDLLDQYMSYYRIFIKSRKWTLRLIFHFIDMAICASYFEYKDSCKKFKVEKKNILKFIDFKLNLGRCMTQINQVENWKRGRPLTESLENISTSPSRYKTQPISDVRFDGIEHWPLHDDAKNSSRCKNGDCTKRTQIHCSKCGVHLCITKDINCFINFHKK
jgi:hypothetical protein